MKQLSTYNFTKILVAIVALVMIGASVFSMAAMNHGVDNAGTCMTGMAEHTGCTNPVQAEACIDFHFSLLEKFSHGFADNVGFKFLSVLVVMGSLLFAAYSLLNILRYKSDILKVRLRYLRNDTIAVFQESLGFWLTILEKRDPAYAFVIA
jgi:hypothetical protein